MPVTVTGNSLDSLGGLTGNKTHQHADKSITVPVNFGCYCCVGDKAGLPYGNQQARLHQGEA